MFLRYINFLFVSGTASTIVLALGFQRKYKYCTNSGSKCDSTTQSTSRSTTVAAIYNASYGLTVAACVLLAVGIIIFGLYVWGNRDQRCVPLHLFVVLVIAAAVITFAVGLPKATEKDSGTTAPPFFNGSSGAPGVCCWCPRLQSRLVGGLR